METENQDYKNELEESVDRFIASIKVFKEREIEKVTEMASAIAESIKRGNTIYSCGNGGSAADSQHIAGEFIGRFLLDRRPLPFVSLNTDTSVLTCVGNDFGFDYIFSRQIEALGRKDDIFIVFSTSGNSKNIIIAVEAAKKIGLKVLSFTGEKGSKLDIIERVLIYLTPLIPLFFEEEGEIY